MPENKQQKKILIVDDDYVLCIFLEKILTKHNYDVYIAQSANEAFTLLDEVKPDLIISDIIMPEINGIEFCSMVRSNPEYKNIPFIFLSVKKRLESKITSFKVGADDYIEKPFHIKELLARIEARLRKISEETAEEKIVHSPIMDNTTVIKLENEAIEALQNQNFEKAFNIFKNLWKNFPNNENYKNYLKQSALLSLSNLINKFNLKTNSIFKKLTIKAESVELKNDLENIVYNLIDGKLNLLELTFITNFPLPVILKIINNLIEKKLISIVE